SSTPIRRPPACSEKQDGPSASAMPLQSRHSFLALKRSHQPRPRPASFHGIFQAECFLCPGGGELVRLEKTCLALLGLGHLDDLGHHCMISTASFSGITARGSLRSAPITSRSLPSSQR